MPLSAAADDPVAKLQAFWNARYAGEEFVYGREPNDFVVQAVPAIPHQGRVLCLADGEGRNSVWLAGQGFRVTAVEDRRRLCVLDVERQALLAAVRPDEMRREAAHAAVVGAREVADTRALDLDDPRAEVGELPRAERRRDRVLERDDGDAFEGKHRDLRQNDRGSPSVCSATCDRIRLVEIGATW